MDTILASAMDLLRALTYLLTFVGIGALIVGPHTLIVLTTTPQLRVHAPLALLSYLLIYGLFATTCALVVRHYFQPSPADFIRTSPSPLWHYFIPSLYALPLMIGAAISATAGTHMYAHSRLSSPRAHVSTGILVLASALAGFGILMTSIFYAMWLTG